MKYKIDKDYLYIQTSDKEIRAIPLDSLSNDDLGETVRELAVKGQYSEDIKIEWKIRK